MINDATAHEIYEPKVGRATSTISENVTPKKEATDTKISKAEEKVGNTTKEVVGGISKTAHETAESVAHGVEKTATILSGKK